MIIEEHLSRIEQLFQNYKELLNKDQQIFLKFQIQGYKEKSLRDQLIIESILNDNMYSIQALFIGEAAKQLKEYSSEHFRNIDEMAIQLQKWKLVKFEKNQNYLVIIYEFNYYGKVENSVQCIPYDPDSQFTQKKLKLTIQKNTKNNMKINHQNDQQNDNNNILNNPYIDLQTKKKVKIEALNYKPIQDSFVIDSSLINCTLPENPSSLINRSIMQFNKQQQQAQEYIKISALFPNQSKWALEGRIILKSDIQEFKNKRTGQNQQYFKIIILDCEQETISGLFYEKATQKFFDKLEINKVYVFKNACINQDKTDGSKKITFNEYSIISDSNNFTIPTNPQITISTIKEIQESTLTGSFDIAIVVQEIKSETQNSKTLIVLDQTGKILIKLWGDQYKNVEFKKGEIMVFKGLQIHVYNNQKQLYTGYQTIILKNESVIPELKALKNWLIGKNIDTIFKPQQETQNLDLQQFQELVLKQLNDGNIQQQFNNQVYAYIMEIQERNTMYASCPNSRCLSKMDFIESRKTFKCKKCSIENDQPKYRYILKVTIMDDTSNISATIFDENASKLLQLSADEFKQLTQLEQHQKLIISSYRQKKIKLQARFREFQGYTQPQYQVDEIEDIDYKMLANEEIKKFEDFDYLLNLSYLL